LDGRYQLTRVLRTREDGATWAGRDLHLGRDVVIRVLHPAIAPSAVLTAMDRLLALRHVGVETQYDAGVTADGRAFLVSEFVPGCSLEQLLAAGPLPAGWAERIRVEIGAALAYLHGAGFTHGAVRPSHIFVPGDVTQPAKLVGAGSHLVTAASHRRPGSDIEELRAVLAAATARRSKRRPAWGRQRTALDAPLLAVGA
jgi:serine/threonine-protein kinase